MQSQEATNIEQVDQARKMNCTHQTVCCSHAANEKWKGFHCRDCTVDEPMSREDNWRDVDGLAALLREIQRR